MCSKGRLSEEDFVLGVKQFVEKSKNFKDDWSLCDVKTGTEKYVYLRKTFFKIIEKLREPRSCSEEHVEVEACSTEDELCDVDTADDAAGAGPGDDACALPDGDSDLLKYDLHVVYSSSYQVPVLYFNIYRQDGALLTLDEVWRQVPAAYQERIRHEKWTFMTQQEHPLLMTPFYQLHPCHTSVVMSKVTSLHMLSEPGFGNNVTSLAAGSTSSVAGASTKDAACRYLVSWLSVVAPVVHLSMPLQWASF